MRKSFLKAAIPTMAMLLVAVMALTGTTYAWFTTTQKATVDTIDIKVTAAAGMKVTTATSASTNSGWTNTLSVATLQASLDNVWPTDLDDFSAVSTTTALSGGLLSFYTAALDSDSSAILASSATAGQEYIKFDVYVWNDATEAKYLNFAGTEVTCDEENEIDATVAARIAVVKQGEAAYSATFATIANGGTTAAIWAKDTATYYGLKKAGTINQPVSNPGTTYSTSVTPVNSFSDSTFKTQIAANSVAKYTVYIWLEGQDPDCINTITTGSIVVDLVINMDESVNP